MRTSLHPAVVLVLTILACGGTRPWNAPGAPKAPPDEQFRTGVEAGEHVYIWHCHEGARVMVTQFGSACFGTREPVVERGACGAPLPGEKRFEGYDRDAGAKALPDTYKWPGSVDGGGT